MSSFTDDVVLDTLPESDEEEALSPVLAERNAPLQHSARDLLAAHAALLDNVAVALQSDGDLYRLVKRHLPALERWHEQHTGWRIQSGAAFFRLERHLHMAMPVFFDERLKEARDFACLTWILWFAERRHLAGGGRYQQFLLSELTDGIQRQTQDMDQAGLDIRNVQDRYSMRRALEYLHTLGGLQVLEGEIKKWSEGGDVEKNEVLYEFTPLAHSLIEALNLRRVEALHLSVREQSGSFPVRPHTSLVNEIPPLVRAWRTLLLGPVLLRYDDAEAFAALSQQAERINDELGVSFGWFLELNRDYACIVRGGGVSMGAGSTIAFNGAFDQMLLLLCTKFREQVEQGGIWTPDTYGCVHVTAWDIASLFNDLRQRYGSYWGTTVQEAKAGTLLEEIYRRMRSTGLLRGPDGEGNIVLLPTVARYSVTYTVPQEAGERARPRTRSRKQRSANESDGSAEPTLFDWSEQE
jgi:hypothetical protein